MNWITIIIALYILIPIISIVISGRKLSWKGWVVFVLLWPIGWMIWGNEELP